MSVGSRRRHGGREVAVVGVGLAPVERKETVSREDRTLLACRNAIADARLTANDIDGLFHWGLGEEDSPWALQIGPALGLKRLKHRWDYDGYGASGGVSSGQYGAQ